MTPPCWRCQSPCELTDEVACGYAVYRCTNCGAENVDVSELNIIEDEAEEIEEVV